MDGMVEENGTAGNPGGDPLAHSPGDTNTSVVVTSVQSSSSEQHHLVAATSIVQLTLPTHVNNSTATAQVQSVIQANQQSVIQTPANIQPVQLQKGNVILVSKPNSVIQTTQGSLQTLQVVDAGSDDSLSNDDDSTKKRRDILTRRPSYRKILNDLGGGEIAVGRDESSSEVDTNEDSELSSHSIPSHYQTHTATVIPAGAIHIASQGETVQGLHTLTMTNATTAGGAIVQYAQGQDGQFFVPGQTLKHRRVKHYGYEFQYNINNVNKDCPLTESIPYECNFLLDRLKERNVCVLSSFPTQMTVNNYQPGQGIPSHVDTHSAFEDPILSLSLGSSIVMEFRHQDGHAIPVLLPRRSLLIMSEEARYAWSHGITPRKMDVVPTVNGDLTIQQRRERTSFTFRLIRKGECNCVYHDQCDSYKKKYRQSEGHIKDDALAAKLESLHVHEVYEEIASHFSDTRHKPWPNVLSFVQSLPFGSILVDVGCGNCKYFGNNMGLFEIGCDHSVGLAKVCHDRGFEVFNCNCLSLPLKSEIADGCLSIAVIHHLATEERRLRAVEEMVRILRPGGRAVIYVWAKDQTRHNTLSSYLKQDRKNRNKDCNNQLKCVSQYNSVSKSAGTIVNEVSHQFPSLPLHTNRTQFQHHDLLVPWKLKPAAKTEPDQKREEESYLEKGSHEVPTFYRYYHVFDEGELEQLCSSVKGAKVVQSYYDQGNWCVTLERA